LKVKFRNRKPPEQILFLIEKDPFLMVSSKSIENSLVISKMLSLESCKLFSNLSAEEQTDLNNASKSIAVAAGQEIFTEGDVGDSLYVILEGKFEICAEVNPNGKVGVLTNLGPGDFFGEMAVLDDEPRSATATAVTDSHVLFIPKAHLQSMLDRSPKFAIILMREFSLRRRDVNQK
jgi:CRP/FNR family transcriptional regulator